jgi:hypothetical protein
VDRVWTGGSDGSGGSGLSGSIGKSRSERISEAISMVKIQQDLLGSCRCKVPFRGSRALNTVTLCVFSDFPLPLRSSMSSRRLLNVFSMSSQQLGNMPISRSITWSCRYTSCGPSLHSYRSFRPISVTRLLPFSLSESVSHPFSLDPHLAACKSRSPIEAYQDQALFFKSH